MRVTDEMVERAVLAAYHARGMNASVEEATVMRIGLEAALHTDQLLFLISKQLGTIMTDLSALQAAVDDLSAKEGAAAAELQALVDQIAGLSAGTITQEQIDALTTQATGVATALGAATDAAVAAEQPPAPAAPVDPGTPAV